MQPRPWQLGFRGLSRWGGGVPVPVGAGSPGCSLLARSALCPPLSSSVRVVWLVGPCFWGFGVRCCSRLLGFRARVAGVVACLALSQVRLNVVRVRFACLGVWVFAGGAGLPSRSKWLGVLPRVSSPDLVLFGALSELVPGPLIGSEFSFPRVWLPGWLPSSLAEDLLQGVFLSLWVLVRSLTLCLSCSVLILRSPPLCWRLSNHSGFSP